MIYASKRPVRKQAFPTLGALLHDVVNAPMKDVVNDKIKYTYPAVNVMEYDDHFMLQLAVPGYNKKEIEINVDNDELIISSSRENKDEVKYQKREFNYGSFTRKFALPQEVVADKIEASFSDGILSIHIPKAEEVKPIKIAVK
jgi:HSP20 family protein